MVKAVAFTLAVMMMLMAITAAGVSAYTHSWVPLQGVGIAFAIFGIIAAIEIPLIIWADKKFGE